MVIYCKQNSNLLAFGQIRIHFDMGWKYPDTLFTRSHYSRTELSAREKSFEYGKISTRQKVFEKIRHTRFEPGFGQRIPG